MQQDREEEEKKKEQKKKALTKDEEDNLRRKKEEELKLEQELLALIAPKKPIKCMLRETSIHGLLVALDKMAEFDRMLNDLGVIACDFLLEDEALKEAGRPFVKELVPLPPLDENRQYSDVPHIQELCS